MGALANLYVISDWSIQQIAIGLAMLPLLVALNWYVSHPVHRLQVLAASRRPGARDRSPGERFWSDSRMRSKEARAA